MNIYSTTGGSCVRPFFFASFALSILAAPAVQAQTVSCPLLADQLAHQKHTASRRRGAADGVRPASMRNMTTVLNLAARANGKNCVRKTLPVPICASPTTARPFSGDAGPAAAAIRASAWIGLLATGFRVFQAELWPERLPHHRGGPIQSQITKLRKYFKKRAHPVSTQDLISPEFALETAKHSHTDID